VGNASNVATDVAASGDVTLANTGAFSVVSTHLSAALPVSQGGTGVASSTGSVNTVLSNSPTINTPTFTGDITLASTQAVLTKQTLSTFNDNNNNTIGGAINNKSGLIRIVDTGGSVTIPFFSAGGSGVAYVWTVLDPDTGWVVNGVGFSFSFAVSGGNTYTLAGTSGDGDLTIQRTAGASSYTTQEITY
jgi:hypothetical protein